MTKHFLPKFFVVFFAVLAVATGLQAQPLTNDANTLLLLSLDNSTTGASGELPTTSTGISYETAIHSAGARVAPADVLSYAALGNIAPAEGTVEFWFKPTWAGDDGQDHILFSVGNDLRLLKDGGNYLRFLIRNDDSEAYKGLHLGSWQANKWHHIAITWKVPGQMVTYIDGAAVITNTASTQDLMTTLPANLHLGGSNGSSNGLFDEFRISGMARSASEIALDFWRGTTVTSISLATTSLDLYQNWNKYPGVAATVQTSNLGTINVGAGALQWSVANTSLVSVNAAGQFTSNSATGTTTATATAGGRSASMTVKVLAPARAAEVETPSAFLRTPAAGYTSRIPVVQIVYIPTKDGVNVDGARADFSGTIEQMKAKVREFATQTKFMLEEGSRYRGYKNSAAKPYLGYEIIKFVFIYEPVPPSSSHIADAGAAMYFPDYNQILTRSNVDIANAVNNLGAKEVWMWGYHHGQIVPVESNMSSPTTGDISNSFRFNDDLPVLSKTYTLYNYNYNRSANEAVHNHGHQEEAILGYIGKKQDVNTTLFNQKFVNFGSTGRCGWTHCPPNTNKDYDYWNLTTVQSDIEDWKPAGGPTKGVNANTWGNLSYTWPDNHPPFWNSSDAAERWRAKTEAQWYIYWMQNQPGNGNAIEHSTSGRWMTNWWKFISDWDAANNASLGLHATTPAANEPSVGTGTLTLTCPPTPVVPIQIQPGNTCAPIVYALPVATSTCAGGATMTKLSGPSSGDCVTAGTHAICFRATDACGNSQSCCFSITVLPPVTGQADLTLANLSLSNSSAATGGQIAFKHDYKNIGTANAPQAFFSAYLSTDNVISPNDLLGNAYLLNPILAGQTMTQLSGTLTVPAIAAAGDYYVILVADSQNAIAESNEANNVLVSTSKITVTASAPCNKTALLVAGSTSLNNSDFIIRSNLVLRGWTVTVKDDDAVTVADAAGKGLVLISNSASSSTVGSKFRDVAVPVLTWEDGVYDDMKMTSDKGTTSSKTKIQITAAAHQMAAGQSGTRTVFSSSSDMTWGVPSSSAIKVAVYDGGSSSRSSIFGYEKNAAMVGMNAPARRTAFFMQDNAHKLTADGWALFYAAINWTAGCPNATAFAGSEDEGEIADEPAETVERTATAAGRLRLFPNPASGSAAWLDLSDFAGKNASARAQVFDQNGLMLSELSSETDGTGLLEIALGDLPNGVYFVRVSTPGLPAQRTEKLVVLRGE